MKKEVKKKLIIIVVVAIILAILSVVLSVNQKNKTPSIETLNNDELFFTIQKAINNELSDNDVFVQKKVLFKQKDNTTYYFINGYQINFWDENSTYKSNSNYFMVIKGNSYYLKDLDTTNIEEYAKDFTDYDKEYNLTTIPLYTYSENGKLSSYIADFIYLTVFDIERAYNLLTTKEQNKNTTLYNFSQNISNYSNLSTQIKSVTKSKTGNKIFYSITDSKDNKITIIESSTMNYKIEL